MKKISLIILLVLFAPSTASASYSTAECTALVIYYWNSGNGLANVLDDRWIISSSGSFQNIYTHQVNGAYQRGYMSTWHYENNAWHRDQELSQMFSAGSWTGQNEEPEQVSSRYDPPSAPGCPGPPPPCPEEGEILPGQTTAEGSYPDIYCVDDCQLVEPEHNFLIINDIENNLTSTYDLVYTGEHCEENDVVATNYPDLLNPLPADNQPSTPLVKLGDPPELYPDQDKDGIPAGNDPDVDGDGIPNGEDPDVDGDGEPNGSDPDVDGDMNRNGGGYSVARWNPTEPAAKGTNGIGADPDVDGDDLPNGNDPDVDGDGYPNGKDGDIDGDGYPNIRDGDIDGDAKPNDEDTTPYGIGGGDGDGKKTYTMSGTGNVEGGDDTPPDNDNTSEDPGEDDENLEGPGDGDAIESASCPAGEICIGDGVCQSGELSTSSDCTSDTYFQDRFQLFSDNIKSSGLFSLPDNMSSIPSGGSSIKTVNLGAWGGVQQFDFSEFNFVWSILNAVFTIGFMWVGIKIITLQRS